MVIFVLAGTAIVVIGRIAGVAATVVNNTDNATFLLAFQSNSEMAAELFWGLWLLPLALLILKSNRISKIIGILLLAACAAHLAVFGLYFIAHDLWAATESALLVIGMIGEFSLVLWLLIRACLISSQNIPTLL